MQRSARNLRIMCAGAALGLALAPTAALAQSLSFAKSEAILGGAPSRLAAILSEQKSIPAPAGAAQAALQPASFSTPSRSYPVLRDTGMRSAAASTGRPDVFGSVALTLRRTPLDRKWSKVARAGVTGAAASFAASLREDDELDRIEAVNRYVNRRVHFVDDSRQYGRQDLWTAASETLRRGRGDCEDYAIAKLQMLRAAGVSEGDLYLVIVKDLVRRADHAVLVVRSDGRFLVLDNGTDAVLNAESIRDYRPVLTFASKGAWTHGYRREPSPMVLASASIAPLTPAAQTGERSN